MIGRRRSVLPFLLAAVAMGAGSPSKKKAEPLPALNAKVHAFAKASLGKPVGDGICTTLAVDALRESGAAPATWDRQGDYTWGRPVEDFKGVLPGDILQFRDAVFHGRRTTPRGYATWHYEYPHHTAVVARVEQSGKLITIYHQNVSTKGPGDPDKSKVREGELRMDSLQKGGWVKAYRPAEAEGR